MHARPIAVIPHGAMGPEEFEQSKYRLEAAGYVVLRVRSALINDPIYVAASTGDAGPRDAIADAAIAYIRAHRRMVARLDSVTQRNVLATHKALEALVPE